MERNHSNMLVPYSHHRSIVDQPQHLVHAVHHGTASLYNCCRSVCLQHVRLCMKIGFLQYISSVGRRSCILALSPTGHAGGSRVYATVTVWVPAMFHGACSGRSKSRSLASHHRVAFRESRGEQHSRKHTHLLSAFCSTETR